MWRRKGTYNTAIAITFVVMVNFIYYSGAREREAQKQGKYRTDRKSHPECVADVI